MVETIIIEFTCPIDVGKKCIAEFEAGAEILITSRGRRAQIYGPPENCYPEEEPEWEIGTCYVDIGEWKALIKRWRADLVPAPAPIEALIREFLDTDYGQETVATKIREGGDG